MGRCLVAHTKLKQSVMLTEGWAPAAACSLEEKIFDSSAASAHYREEPELRLLFLEATNQQTPPHPHTSVTFTQ